MTGGQVTERQVGNAVKADTLGRFVNRYARRAMKVSKEILPEVQVLGNCQFRLHRIAMAEIMARFRRSHLGFYSFAGYLHLPPLGSQQTGHRAQQRRFSRAVTPGQHQRLTVA